MSKDNNRNDINSQKQGATRSNPLNKSFEKNESSEELKQRLSEKAKKDN